MKDLFKKIINDFIHKDLTHVKSRINSVPLDVNKIVTIIGARRCGKTYLMYTLIKQLRKNSAKENFVYFNFDDDRLFPLELGHLNNFVESYYELFPEKKKVTVYFFLDELQNVTNWELFVRRIYDTENCRIYLTGSSSRLLSKEIATSLRGRSLVYEIFPLSFKEYINWNNIPTDLYLSENVAYIKNHFNTFVHSSSLPETINQNDEYRLNISHEYINMIIFKDLVERYRLTNHFFIKYLIKFLLNNVGNYISITKVYYDFKSLGISISKSNLFQYIDYLEDAFLFFKIPVFTQNIREKNRNPQKIYAIDFGLKAAVSLSEDIGRVYENIVFIELRRECKEIFYAKNFQEVDFCFIHNHNHNLNLINVTYSLENKQTKNREIKGLIEAMKVYGCEKATIINNDLEDNLSFEGKTIQIIPLWKWLLKKET